MSIKIWDPNAIVEGQSEPGAWVIKASNLASQQQVLDIDGHYTSSNVEGCLMEIGSDINVMKDEIAYLHEHGGGGSGGGGGGGGGPAVEPPTIELLSEAEVQVSTDDTVDIYYFFKTPNSGFGTAYISVDYVTQEQNISPGNNKFTITGFEKGEHRVDIYVVDIAGNFTSTITVKIVAGGLHLSSNFDDSNDITLQDHIKIKYNLESIGYDPITVYLTIDGKTTELQDQKAGSYTWDIGILETMGIHEATIYATSGRLVSNKLIFNLVLADGESLFVSTKFTETTIEVSKNLQIDYRNSMQDEINFLTYLFIDGVQVDVVNSSLGYNFWNVGDQLSIGVHTFKLYSTTMDGSIVSNELNWTIEVITVDYVPYEIVKHDLICNFDANGKQQDSLTRDIWEDTSGNGVQCKLYNFNYGTNGWIDNALVFNGKTYAEIDYAPFAENATYGLTIDILYKVKNVGDINGKVLWCANPMTPYQGVYIDTQVGSLRSRNSKITECQFQDDTWTRMTWVIDRNDNIMIQYVNGVITKAAYMSTTEPFTFDGKIILGASFNETQDNLDENGKPIPHYAQCAIKNFRIYDCALTDEEVLQNVIADIKDRDEQLAKRELNYGESTIPTLKFEGVMEGMSGEVYKNLTLDYDDPLHPEKRFRKEGCQVSWQGTSSLEYPVKNYTIKLRDGGNDWEYAPKDDWIPESRYTLKANFMDSSQANNIGTARYVNWFFNRVNTPYPQQIKNSATRSAVDGFPVRLIINGQPMGIYMFNIDRYAYNNMGLTGEKNAVSYEIAVNSVTGAGAFADDSWNSIRSEFEMRYHYAGDEGVVCETIGAGDNAVTVLKAGYHSELQALISWVKNSTLEEFRSELDEHFSVTHLIDYYLIVYLFGLVDNLGKNMVLTTFGKNAEGNTIWYPSFYDCDSELGLTNDGQLRYGPGIDMQFDDFNTSQSNLWVKLKEMFGNEIAERYMYLRSNGIFTYDRIMEFFEDSIINAIGETFYNEDQRIKYVNEKNSAWIYMSNGSRLEHMKRWISERFVYLDSVYEYGVWQNSAVIRSNVPDGEYTLNFKTASPQWVQISFSDQTDGIKKFYCDKDKWYSVTGRIQNAVDNNMPIKGIDGIMYIDGIEFLNISSLLLGSARQLCELNIPDNKRIIQLEVGKNTMLQKLNCKNCTLLGSNPNYKSINLSECVALKYVDLSGTQVGEVKLNEDGGSLEYFNLAGSKITVLNCNKQEFLDAIYMDDCVDLAAVTITNCNALNSLSITNTKLESLVIQNCGGIKNLDISNNGHVKELSLRGCEALKTLNASNLTNTGMTEIDLRDSLALETINIQGSFNIHNIRLNEGLSSLKSIIVRESGIQSLQFGYEEKPNYLDLGKFPAMNNVSFQNCTSLKEIRNMNMTLDNGNYIFSGCKELVSVSGFLKVNGDMRQTFANCNKLKTLPELDLSEVRYMYHSFDTCQSLTWNDAKTVFNSLGEACETIDNVFSGSQISGGVFDENIFSKVTNVRSLQYPFRGITMSGQVPAKLFANNPELRTITAVLEGASGSVPDDLFANNPELTSVTWLFGYVTSNKGITVGPTSKLFRNNPKITNLYGCFYGLHNAVFTLDNDFFANLPLLTNVQEIFYNCLKLEGSIPPNLFAKNPELNNVRSVFARDVGDSNNTFLNNISGSIPSTLFRNNTKLTTVRNAFGNCTRLTGNIPNDLLQGLTNLTDISNLFANCTGLTGKISTEFWKDCPKIRTAENVFQSTNIGAQDGTANDLPADFFSNKPMLESVAGMFNNCININFVLPPFMFQDCIRLINIASLFAGCTYFDGQLNENIFTIINPSADKVYYRINTTTQKRIITENPINKDAYEQLTDEEKAEYVEDYVEVESTIENASGVFDNCNRMRGMIPEGIFRNLINVKDLGGIFQRCSSLTGPIPDDLLKKCRNLVSARAMFAYCSGLGKNSAELTDVDPYFISSSFFSANTSLENVGWTFAYMSALQGQIPGNLFVTNTFITNMDYLFYNSALIKGEIPSNLFSTLYLLQNLSYAFNNCKSLTAISATLLTIAKNPRISNMQSTFNGCSNLTGTAPAVWNLYPGAGKANCFTGCTKLSNYSAIPSTWK